MVYIIRNWFREEEYLLIENRQPIGYDSQMWEGGLLIWHIDDNVENNNEAGFPQQSGWPENGLHYRVAVLGADRKYHLERGINAGDHGDFWVKGHELLPGPLESKAKDFSMYPNSNSYTNGPTGIRITDISPSRHSMLFKVKGLKPLGPPTSRPTPFPTPRPTPTVSFEPIKSLLTASEPSTSTPVSLTEPPPETPIATPSFQSTSEVTLTESSEYPFSLSSTLPPSKISSVFSYHPVADRPLGPHTKPSEFYTSDPPYETHNLNVESISNKGQYQNSFILPLHVII
jgi:hypothetical protein